MKITVIEKFDNGKLTERTVIQEDENRDVHWVNPQVIHGDEWWKKLTTSVVFDSDKEAKV